MHCFHLAARVYLLGSVVVSEILGWWEGAGASLQRDRSSAEAGSKGRINLFSKQGQKEKHWSGENTFPC